MENLQHNLWHNNCINLNNTHTMKFTTQSTFVLITILAFLTASIYTSNLNYLIAGGFFSFFFAPNKTEK